MSAINNNKVKQVLLSDGWHHVIPETFCFSGIEFRTGDEPCALLEYSPEAAWFSFVEIRQNTSLAWDVIGPASAIRAMRVEIDEV